MPALCRILVESESFLNQNKLLEKARFLAERRNTFHYVSGNNAKETRKSIWNQQECIKIIFVRSKAEMKEKYYHSYEANHDWSCSSKVGLPDVI